jgi:hypothetical protein
MGHNKITRRDKKELCLLPIRMATWKNAHISPFEYCNPLMHILMLHFTPYNHVKETHMGNKAERCVWWKGRRKSRDTQPSGCSDWNQGGSTRPWSLSDFETFQMWYTSIHSSTWKLPYVRCKWREGGWMWRWASTDYTRGQECINISKFWGFRLDSKRLRLLFLSCCRVVVLSLHARNPDQHSLKGTEVKFESSSTKGGLDDRCAACGIVSPVKPKAI